MLVQSAFGIRFNDAMRCDAHVRLRASTTPFVLLYAAIQQLGALKNVLLASANARTPHTRRHTAAMEARRNELLRVDIGADPALQHEWAELCESLDAQQVSSGVLVQTR